MTEYGSMTHQQLYDYVFSGSPSSVESEATLNQNHAKSVTEATNDLQKTLTNIQASWSGAAADEFTQQANAIVAQMQKHAQTADNTYTWMDYASRSLTWAQQNIPSPPSGAEQTLADVNTNKVSEWGIGLLTGGTSYLASKAAEEDIANKKAAAVSVMTQLASAYTTASGKLSSSTYGGIDGGTDTGGGSSSTKKNGQDGSGNSTSGSGSSSNANGMIMPMAMAVPSSGSTGSDSGSSPVAPTGTGRTASTGSTGSGTGTTGSGATSSSTLPTTVTAGLGDLPPGTTPSAPVAATTAGSGYSSKDLGVLSPGGLANFGGSGAAGEGSFGSTGGSGGSGTGSALSGGTGTGELGDEEAGGTGSGLQTGTGSGTAAAAAEEAESTGPASQNTMMGGGMGGMGHGMGGGGQEERGGRASWLKEDPDYWYGDKMKNAAPPGGVIE